MDADSVAVSTLLAGGLLVLLAVATPDLLRYWSIAHFPLNGRRYGWYPKRMLAYVYHAEALYREGYVRFKNALYRLTTADGERIVVPISYLEELRRRTDDEINNTKALTMAIEGRYTGLDADSPFLNHVVRADLTRNLPRLNARLSAEVERALATELPPCADWTPVVINEALLRIVAIVSGHVFLGPALCRREEYLHASIRFTVDVFAAVRALKRWPALLRPLAARLATPELRRIADHRARARAFLTPIIRARREAARRGDQTLPDDMLQWMIDKADATKEPASDDELAFVQLQLSMAAIHTTTMTATHILYDLVAHPDVVEDLRAEVRSVLRETGGVVTTHALFQMKLLDSVMRESQRMNPLSMARFTRYVEKPLTLHDGTKIPAGVVIESPHLAVTRDPELYPDPDTFDPYRFYRLRTGEVPDPLGYKSTEQYQFVTVTKENMGFGYGRHACPGRFFAANEIKMILAHMLLRFDMKLPASRAGKRYPNLVVAHSIVPDPKGEILLRRVQS